MRINIFEWYIFYQPYTFIKVVHLSWQGREGGAEVDRARGDDLEDARHDQTLLPAELVREKPGGEETKYPRWLTGTDCKSLFVNRLLNKFQNHTDP